MAVDLINTVPQRPLARLGDRSYDICYANWSRGTLPMIPTKSTRKAQFTVDPALYSLHNRIERYFNKIKNARCVATRYWLSLVDRT